MNGDLQAAARIVRDLGAAGGFLPADPERTGLMEDLRRAGVVEPLPDGGWRVGPRSSVLSAERVRALRSGFRYGAECEVLASVASTNDVVLERAAHGARPGLVVCAELQTAGRGRRGRAFDSRPGLGIWSTTLLDAPPAPEMSPRLSLIAALAVAGAVETETGLSPAVKWPNDVTLSGRKICGILVEARSSAGRTFPVAGIGLNVHHRDVDFPPELNGRASSLQEITACRPDRSRVLASVMGELEALLEQERRGRLDLVARFAERDGTRDRDVSVRTAAGTLLGRAAGVAEDGALLLRVASGKTVAVRSGEATLR